MNELQISLKNKENKVIELDQFSSLNIEVLHDSHLTLKLANFSNQKEIKISAKIGKNSSFDVIFADFAQNDVSLKSIVNLVDEGASCMWHLATLSNSNYHKIFDVSFNHCVGHTSALMDNYGVAKDNSSLVFCGCNHIFNGAKASVTKQNAKIIVFDKEACGSASPTLKIDENDVQASHGAVVGQLNSNHLFYLMSRGLSELEARMIITLGYLKPISLNFSHSIQDKVEKTIKEAIR